MRCPWAGRLRPFAFIPLFMVFTCVLAVLLSLLSGLPAFPLVFDYPLRFLLGYSLVCDFGRNQLIKSLKDFFLCGYAPVKLN